MAAEKGLNSSGAFSTGASALVVANTRVYFPTTPKPMQIFRLS